MYNRTSKRNLLSVSLTALMVIFLISSSVAYGSNAATVAETEILEDLEAGRISSAAVGISDNGEIIYSSGYGMADQARGLAADSSTLFNIGSVSKIFTAVAVMILVDDGWVELDEPVTKYLPEFVMEDERYHDITVRMLLNHTSGLPGTILANTFGYAYNESTNQVVLEVLARSHLRHNPGEFSVYCNDGFSLAEMIVERMSGQSFMEFLSARVFQPLSLDATDWSIGKRTDGEAALYYAPDTGRPMPREVVSLLGAGGLGSTAIDLVRFAEIFSGLDATILSESSLKEMQAAQPSLMTGMLRGADLSYGLGWDVTNLPRYQSKGIQVLGKSGGTLNYSSMLLTVPAHRVSVAVTQSGLGGDAKGLAIRVLDALLVEKGVFGDEETLGIATKGPESIPSEYAEYGGYYVGGGGELVHVQFDFTEDTVTMLAYVNGVEIPVGLFEYSQGNFCDDYGNTAYFAHIGTNRFLVSEVLESDMIRFEKLDPVAVPKNLEIDMDGRLWVRRNAESFEGVPLSGTHLIQSYTIEVLPGYVYFEGVKRVDSPRFAGMPAKAVRDLKELTLFDMDGEIWVWDADMLYSPAVHVRVLEPAPTTVTIGSNGYSEWLRVGADTVLDCDMPEEGRMIVFSVDGSPIYDSIVDDGEVSVPEASFVELIGKPGDVFYVR